MLVGMMSDRLGGNLNNGDRLRSRVAARLLGLALLAEPTFAPRAAVLLHQGRDLAVVPLLSWHLTINLTPAEANPSRIGRQFSLTLDRVTRLIGERVYTCVECQEHVCKATRRRTEAASGA